MMHDATSIEAKWNGPYSWPGYESANNLPYIPKIPGVYLQTFEYQNGYLIYAAGITRRPVPVRFKEHTLKYMNGEYTILDVTAIQHGVRKEIWHGWGYARKHRMEFEERKPIFLDAASKQLAAFRVFIIDIGREPRILERLEASIMNKLYQQPSPLCDIPDRGMKLAPRLDSENRVIIKNTCDAVLYWLPEFLEI